MGKPLGLTYEELRSLVMEALREPGNGQLIDLYISMYKLAVQWRIVGPRDHLNERWIGPSVNPFMLAFEDQLIVREILWDLIIEGVLRPGSLGLPSPSQPFFGVTEWGKTVLKDGAGAPYDPDGYSSQLKKAIPSIDPVIITYLNEGLRTLRFGSLLASANALSCASERALFLLIAAYADSLAASSREKFRKDTEGQVITRQFSTFRTIVQSDLKSRLPNDLEDGLDGQLAFLVEFIRLQRSDAGHPTGKTIERERAYANLVVFPTYIKKVYALIDWLKANPGAT